MNISYEWKITALKQAPTLDGLSNVITHVNFEYKGTDAESGESAVFNGACPVATPESGSFIPASDLTQDEVIAWAQANHPTDHMDEVIEKAISEKITPTNDPVGKDEIPWLPSNDPTPEAEEIVEE